MTRVDGSDRRFRDRPGVRRLDEAERDRSTPAFEAYQRHDPEVEEVPRDRLRRQGHRRQDRLRDRQRGPAELQRADRGLQPGARQRHRAVDEAGQRRRAQPGCRRRAMCTSTSSTTGTARRSRSARCKRTPTRCSATPRSTESVTSSANSRPYESDLDWSELTEPDELAEVIEQLGRRSPRCTASATPTATRTFVDFQTEDAIVEVIGDRDDDFVDDMVSFGLDYAATVRDDHRHFVEAFREGRIPGVSST